jgi:hypothetical protein
MVEVEEDSDGYETISEESLNSAKSETQSKKLDNLIKEIAKSKEKI